MNKLLEVNTIKTVDEFVDALVNLKFPILTELLSETGKFQIQDTNLETIDVDKKTFLSWFFSKIDTTSKLTIDLDFCLYCKIGNPVLIINEGQFPRTKKDDSERSKTGLMLEIIDGKIEEVRFCYTFRVTENKYAIEIKGERIKQLMSKGFSFEAAYKIACTH